MPATAATTSPDNYLSLAEAAARLEQLTGLQIDYNLFKCRIRRASSLPAPIYHIYLRRWGRESRHIHATDLPLWAEWLRQN